MGSRSWWPGIASFVVVFAAISPGILVSPAHAALDLRGASATVAAVNDIATYIVVQTDAPLALYRGGVAGLAATNPEARKEARLDPTSSASQAYLTYLGSRRSSLLAAMRSALGRSLTANRSYAYAIAGIAVTLTSAEAAKVSSLSGVAFVRKQELLETLTDNGPMWMDADDVWAGTATGGPGTKGEGIVAGIIDTGVNTDHPSFAAVGPIDGYVHANPRGHRFGVCLADVTKCNDKLIGLYGFTGPEVEDDVGHGSHTASTVAGNVVDATLYAPTTTLSRRISGVAPHANVISYKACQAANFNPAGVVNLGTCPLDALLAAIDQATADVVDVINFSIGGGSADPWQDPLGLSFFGSRSAGIFVAASAGNSGPNPSTVGRPANSPWLLALGASTHDRRPTGRLMTTGGASALPVLTGMTVTSGAGPLPIVDAKGVGNELCNTFTATQAAAITGRIVVCTQGVIGRVAKGENVKAAGGAGMVLVAQAGAKASVIADTHVLPAVMISEFDGATLRSWLAGGTGHSATIEATIIEEDAALADRMAYFSSRGPDLNIPNVIKPDVTAPGVAILAAYNTHAGPPNTPEYNIIQGTSMSSPHAAGAGALVRAAHRDWTPDQVKSALMSTGFTTPDGGKESVSVTKEDHATPADPFDRGGGRINVARAVRAGLTLDESVGSYQAANPALGGSARGLNLASLANDDCRTTCTWSRIVTSTASGAVAWTVTTASSSGFTLSVSPSTFTLAPSALGLPSTQTVTITATNTGLVPSFWQFGEVRFAPSTALPAQHFPVAVKAKGAAPAQACAIPDTTVVTDPSDATVNGQPVSISPAHDIREIGVAGLFPTFGDQPIPNIAFRMKVASLSVLPPESHWRIAFVPPGAPAGTSYFVQMLNGTSGSPSFVYGTLSGGSFSILGAPEAGGFTSNGTITITIAATKILSPQIGQTITGIVGAAGPAVPGTLTTNIDSTSAGTYTLRDCAKPDLTLASGDIAVTGLKETTTIAATIRNVGDVGASNVAVRFLVDGAQLGADKTIASIAAGGTGVASTIWDTKHVQGDHVITVVADPASAISEIREDNNSASRIVNVRGNRVRNGSFEQQTSSGQPDGWTPSGSTGTSNDPTLATDGTRSVSVIGTGGPTGGSWTSSPFGVTAGETLVVSVSVRGFGASSAPSLTLSFTGLSGKVISTAIGATGAAGSAIGTLTGTVSVPAGATGATVTLQGFAPTDLHTTGTVVFDDVGAY
ncbi:MAG TPA: S8 family serine peptidase [Candidatus Limnocylindria bacterium]|jgi:subtilisin family serine protease|nr:S8 family serine peptidase [Candidatus Limnocylindria bacterium]